MAWTQSSTSVTGWRSLSRTVRILVFARAVNRLGAFTLPFVAVTVVRDFDASVGQAGYALAAFGLATIPSRLLGGRLADQIGAKATILIGLVGTAAAQLCVAGSQSLPQVTTAMVLLGLMFEIYEPPSQALIADVTPAEQRPMAYGLLAAAMAAAGMGAGLLAAVLAGVDLRWLFVVDAATCLICAALVTVLLPQRRDEPQSGHVRGINAWADRRLLAMLALGTVFAVVYLQITIALPLTLTERGHSPVLIGVLLTVSTTTMVLGQPLLALPRMRALDHFTAMTVGFIIMAGGLLLNGFVISVPGFIGATIIWSVGDLLLLGHAYTIVASIAPDTARGQYMSIYGISWGLAAIGAPLLGTQLLQHSGPELTWSCAAALCLAMALAQPRLRHSIQRR